MERQRTILATVVLLLSAGSGTMARAPGEANAGPSGSNIDITRLADNVYGQLIQALGQMKGADDALREQTGRAQGKVRVCLMIARGCRGDRSVKSELRLFLKDAKMQTMTVMRFAALRAFEAMGTADDLAFLQEVARTDPLEVWNFGGPLFEMIDGKLVNTGERMAPVPARTDPRWSAPNSSSYAIRSAAERAMKQIKDRRDGRTSLP